MLGVRHELRLPVEFFGDFADPVYVWIIDGRVAAISSREAVAIEGVAGSEYSHLCHGEREGAHTDKIIGKGRRRGDWNTESDDEVEGEDGVDTPDDQAREDDKGLHFHGGDWNQRGPHFLDWDKGWVFSFQRK